MSDLAFSFFLSFKVGAIATLFSAFFGILLAYLLARKQFRGRELLDSLLTLPIILPPTVTGYYLLLLLGRNGLLGRYIYEYTGWTLMFTWQAAGQIWIVKRVMPQNNI
jgi:molybdate transport system permease protein